MGILHKRVSIIGKVDPPNSKWQERHANRVHEAIAGAAKIEDANVQDGIIREPEQQTARSRGARHVR